MPSCVKSAPRRPSLRTSLAMNAVSRLCKSKCASEAARRGKLGRFLLGLRPGKKRQKTWWPGPPSSSANSSAGLGNYPEGDTSDEKTLSAPCTGNKRKARRQKWLQRPLWWVCTTPIAQRRGPPSRRAERVRNEHDQKIGHRSGSGGCPKGSALGVWGLRRADQHDNARQQGAIPVFNTKCPRHLSTVLLIEPMHCQVAYRARARSNP